MKYDIENIKNRKKNTKEVKKILDIIIIILLYNVILVFISCFNKIDNISLFGYKAYIITTNSMQPSIYSGDIVIVKEVDEDELKIGDLITFKQNNKVITHRITNIEIISTQKIYTTKGDNNNIEDEQKVQHYMIEGKKVLTIPKLGHIIKILENEIIFLIIVIILLILLFFKIRKEEKMEIRREKKKIEQEKRKKNSIPE